MLLSLVAIACSGGGPSTSASTTPTPPPTGSPTLQVLPATFDFGKVTATNTPAPLEVTMKNNGSASLRVSDIRFSAISSPTFSLGFSAGTKPCGSATPTIAAGGSCTFQVTFQPPGNGSYSSSVQIASNDGASPLFGLPIVGAAEAVSAVSLRINQLETSCPASNGATAYVSVIDQGGFPLLGLNTGNFTLSEGGTNLLFTSTYVEVAYRPIAIAAVVDHSGSITDQPTAFADMKKGFESLFSGLRANDVGQLINFDTTFEVVVAFPTPSNVNNPSNKAALIAANSAPWDKGRNTMLWDSIYAAIDDSSLQSAYRRAVIVATDGRDEGATAGVPASKNTVADVINNAVAKRVPVFAIGIGTAINSADLQQLASQTGGGFYLASTSQNLATIFQQLSSVLYEKQYILAFNQLSAGAGVVSPLTIGVVTPTGVTGSATTSITACN
jgi:Ca-activated chloride channel homolog